MTCCTKRLGAVRVVYYSPIHNQKKNTMDLYIIIQTLQRTFPFYQHLLSLRTLCATFCTMFDTHSSSFLCICCTPSMAAAFQFDSVSHANPLRYGLVGVSFMTVSLDCGPVADAHTSFLCIVGTSFISASLCLRTVSKTDASSLYSFGTSFMHTSLNFGTMCKTYSILDNLVGASFVAASSHPCSMSAT